MAKASTTTTSIRFVAVRRALQELILPEMETIKATQREHSAKFAELHAEVKRLDEKVDGLRREMKVEMESLRREVTAEQEALRRELTVKVDSLQRETAASSRELGAEIRRSDQVLSNDIVRLEQKLDLSLELRERLVKVETVLGTREAKNGSTNG